MVFSKKVNSLFSKENSENLFVKEGLKVSSECTSTNGAKKYSTSGDDFVDNFTSISHFKEPRSYEDISNDMRLLWSQNCLLCLKLAFYIRLITRKSKIVKDKDVEILDVQRGAGLKHEGIMRMLWLALNQPETFKANFNYIVAVGSWKDVFQMLSLDLQYHGWKNKKLDWNFFYLAIAAGLNNSETTHLVRKYLPTIRTNKKCTTLESQADTLIGRWIAKKMFPDVDKQRAYKEYRNLKSSGVAHQWQRLISKQLYDYLDFDTIAGRALALLVGSKFLENHNLTDKYYEWITSKPVAKYTGYVYELFKSCNSEMKEWEKITINKQFEQLVQTGKENVNTNSSLLVVRDTSGSMNCAAKGCNISSGNIAKAMALYFSEFLTGSFVNTFAEFNEKCILHKWKGEAPVDKYLNDRCSYVGNTDFQSVIDLFIELRSNGVPESDFPSGILCVSDSEFDDAKYNDSTNFQEAIRRLKEAGFSNEYVNNFRIILWDIPNEWSNSNTAKFEDFAVAPNFFYLSGLDPSVIAFLLGTSYSKSTLKNAKELFLEAMNQDILNKLTIIKKKNKKKKANK